jgi:hypothetical protein
MADLGDSPDRAVKAAVMEPSLPDGAVQHVEAAAALEQARLVAAAQGRHTKLLQRSGRRAPRPVPAQAVQYLGHIWMICLLDYPHPSPCSIQQEGRGLCLKNSQLFAFFFNPISYL